MSHVTIRPEEAEVTLPIAVIRLSRNFTGFTVWDDDDHKWGVDEAEYNRLLALLTSPEPEQQRVCEWDTTVLGTFGDSVIWVSSCGIEHENLDGTPETWEMTYCWRCGRRLRVKGGEG